MCFFSIDDHSRVRLQRNDIDYINASLVEVPDAKRAYILTQVLLCVIMICIFVHLGGIGLLYISSDDYAFVTDSTVLQTF